MALIGSITQLSFFVFYCAVGIDGKSKPSPNQDLAGMSDEERKLHDEKVPGNNPLTDYMKEKTTNCGGVLNTVPGTIDHPEASDRYGNNELCIWVIGSEVPLYFYFSKFNTEITYDFIVARDGATIGSAEIGTYSGKSLDTTFVTKSDAHITFQSDENVIGMGFVMHWRVFSAEEQCKAKDGTCIKSGDTCGNTIEIIENTCEDRCVCCLGSVQQKGYYGHGYPYGHGKI